MGTSVMVAHNSGFFFSKLGDGGGFLWWTSIQGEEWGGTKGLR
jgi:hypothetical protein